MRLRAFSTSGTEHGFHGGAIRFPSTAGTTPLRACPQFLAQAKSRRPRALAVSSSFPQPLSSILEIPSREHVKEVEH